MNGKKTTIKSKLETIASKKPKRLMGFKEWCELVWEPAKKGSIKKPAGYSSSINRTSA